MNYKNSAIGHPLLIGFALSILVGLLIGCASHIPGAAAASAADGPVSKPNDTARSQEPMQPGHTSSGKETATLAGGCFWCTEAIFSELKGVEKVVPGYAGGHTTNPTYQEVCSETTGHAETIQITFDPAVISFHDLLVIFFTTHDPTTLNRQGADVGTSYRSAIFYHGPKQQETANTVIKEIEKDRLWPNPIVTQVVPFTNFYPAEDYHHDYFEQNPQQAYCQIVIAPKVAKFRERFREKLKR